jgi:hypothetical protein
MRTRSKLVLAALAATLLMGLAVGAASANRLSVSNKNFRVVWTELRFLEREGAALVTCPVTLEGSFHYNTIVKTEKALIGFISRASVANASCRGGHATILQESLPWHITYNGFRGVLPRITSVRLLLKGVAFNVEVFFVNCLYKEAVEGQEEAKGEALVEAGGGITGLEADRTIRIRKFSGGGLCPETGGFEGTGRVTLLGNTSVISVRLI